MRERNNYEEGENSWLNNLYINNTLMFTLNVEVIVCIRCEENSHISCNCINSALLRNEQNILKTMILDNRNQYFKLITTDTDLSTSVTINNALPHASLTVEVHFITYDMVSLWAVSENVNFTDVRGWSTSNIIVVWTECHRQYSHNRVNIYAYMKIICLSLLFKTDHWESRFLNLLVKSFDSMSRC